VSRDVSHSEAMELLPEAALDALPPDDQAGVVAHATGCPECGPALIALRDAIAAMAFAAPPVTVDDVRRARVRTRLMARARVLGFASAGVAPRIMGVGPIPAVQRLVNRLRMQVSDFDVIELNEAFASQALACTRALGLADDAEHVNSNGGAIALGHPLGMSGARIAGAGVQELLRRSGRFGLAAMCVGVGQGAALAFERA